ncbi:hypothetical protein GCM10023331_39340 [Algivirga pacifica]|uniref:Phage protein n=2 Tax=Algivirga pacifica TaxID=1162670 RepID=A0ABP9DMW6_9BACT
MKQIHEVIGTLDYDNHSINIDDKIILLSDIKEIKLHHNDHPVNTLSLPIISNLVIDNPDGFPLFRRGEYLLEKTYSKLSISTNTDKKYEVGFYIDTMVKEKILLNFIDYCYLNEVQFIEFTNGKRSYRFKTNLKYDEIQEVKKKHSLKKWI